MKRKQQFLTAEWRKLIMANYSIDPDRLRPYLPAHTELDEWQGKHYVSLVGFMFRNTRVMGLSIPFHRNFPEVNLRFYVRYKENNEWKRGVVFISEIVPKPALSWVANTLFGEKYRTMRMKTHVENSDDQLNIKYSWKFKQWNSLSVTALTQPVRIEAGSKEEFITEHYWGYTKISKQLTGEYQVEHPRWEIYPVLQYDIGCDFSGLYGNDFSSLSGQQPESIFLAEGSPIAIYKKRIIKVV